MRVNVRHVYSGLDGAGYLCAQLDCDSLKVRLPLGNRSSGMKITLAVNHTGSRVARGDRPPPVSFPLRIEREMHADIYFRVLLAKGNNLLEPRAGNHHSRRRDNAELQQLGVCRKRCMAHAEVVGVNDYHSIVLVEAEFLERRVHPCATCGERDERSLPGP